MPHNRQAKQITAAVLVIGNEILSGRTQDVNVHYIAKNLDKKGIRLCEVRFVPDEKPAIIDAVQVLSKQYTYLFTTGGIGPTHDDITTECIAEAFAVDLRIHPEAMVLLKKRYTSDKLTEARKRMACIPTGAILISNPSTLVPGYQLQNVYVMAGVPRIMQGMLDSIIDTLATGKPIHSKSIQCFLGEGDLADSLRKIQEQHPTVDIGIYPFWTIKEHGVNIVIRGLDNNEIDNAADEISHTIISMGGNPLID
jgi:molybdenum cofactor synthesis domain-containing protein